MTASPENLVAILMMALAAMAAKGGGFLAMRWLGAIASWWRGSTTHRAPF